MPRKKTNRNKKRYKKYKKKSEDIKLSGDKEVTKTGQAKSDTIVYRGIGLPNVFYTKMKYSGVYTFNTAAYNQMTLRMNSIFDPDYQVGGGQPMYYDQFANLYYRYCVMACDVQITFINRTNTTEAAFVRVGAYPIAATSTVSDYHEAIERDNCIYSTLGPNTGDQGIVNMRVYGKINKILGLPGDENVDNVVSSFVGFNPTEVAYLHIWAATVDELTAANVHMNYTMTFYVRWFDRRDIERS